MSKPTRSNVQNGNHGWDAPMNGNFQKLMDGPLPVYRWTGDESDLNGSYPATSHDECLVWVNHSVIGLTLYHGKTDHGSGQTTWAPFPAKNPPRTMVSSGNADDNDRILIVNSSGPATITLRPAANVKGELVFVKSVGAGTISVASSSQIDGSNSYNLDGQYKFVVLYSDGSTYHILGQTGGGGGGGSGLPNYSTAEQLTGQNWHDGRAIYQKTVTIGSLPNSTLGSYAHGITSLREMVRFEGTGKRPSPSFNLISIPNVNNQSIGAQIQVSVDATNINLRSSNDYSGYSGVVTLFYTKD